VLGLAVVLVYGGYLVSTTPTTIGIVVAFLMYGTRVFRPLQDLSDKYNILQSAMASSERVFDLLDTPADEQLAEAAVAARSAEASEASNPRVEFHNVWFAYKDEDWVLRDVSLTVEPGEMVAIVGHTGAGKTTLISLLLRFYDVQKGAILVGGRDVREWPLDELRRQFGVVLQDPYVFSGTIESNIRLRNTGISDQRLSEVIREVNLETFVNGLSRGVAEPVLERGASLSSGQKQLLSFARALAFNPRFLILDEATSSVDTDTEFKIREALARMLSGHTSIVIAHRLSTIQKASRIVVMHKGKVRESGSHQELLAERGIYYRLYQLQYRDQELQPAGEAQPHREPELPAAALAGGEDLPHSADPLHTLESEAGVEQAVAIEPQEPLLASNAAAPAANGVEQHARLEPVAAAAQSSGERGRGRRRRRRRKSGSPAATGFGPATEANDSQNTARNGDDSAQS
jgi:ATP-binding cassette subfamily B protein